MASSCWQLLSRSSLANGTEHHGTADDDQVRRRQAAKGLESNCPVNQVEKIVRSVPDYITVQPLGSVLVLTDFTGATFDRDAIRAAKETAVFDKPFVKKSALIGTESLPRDFYEDMTQRSRPAPPSFCENQSRRGGVGREIQRLEFRAFYGTLSETRPALN
jgi:hypothetical protein